MCLSDARLSRVARRLYLFCCWTGSELVFGKRFHRRPVSSESYILCVVLAFFFVCKVFCSLPHMQVLKWRSIVRTPLHSTDRSVYCASSMVCS